MFVLEIVKITYSIYVFPMLKLEATSLSNLWKLADDWLCKGSPKWFCTWPRVDLKAERYLELILIRLDWTMRELAVAVKIQDFWLNVCLEYQVTSIICFITSRQTLLHFFLVELKTTFQEVKFLYLHAALVVNCFSFSRWTSWSSALYAYIINWNATAKAKRNEMRHILAL
jgi:hypothetical protein